MKKLSSQVKRKMRKQNRRKVFGDEKRPRVVFSKSNQYLTVQAVDDLRQHTIEYLCTRELVKKTEGFESKISRVCKSKENASKLGIEFAKALGRKNIKNIVFDRNKYIYHGKVKTFCDRMREWGISF